MRAAEVVMRVKKPSSSNLSVRNVLAGTVQESSDIAGSPFTTVSYNFV